MPHVLDGPQFVRQAMANKTELKPKDDWDTVLVMTKAELKRSFKAPPKRRRRNIDRVDPEESIK